MVIKEQEVIIAEYLLLDVVMSYIEEGVEEGEEREHLSRYAHRGLKME